MDKETPWSDYKFVREWQYAWTEYFAHLQREVIAPEPPPHDRKGKFPFFELFEGITDGFLGGLKDRPRYTGSRKVRAGTAAATGDLAKIERDTHNFFKANWNKVYEGERHKAGVLGMIGEELRSKGVDLNSLKKMQLTDVHRAMKDNGYRAGLNDVDAWLERTGVVKKESLYSALWAKTQGAKWISVDGKQKGRLHEVVSGMYRDAIAESLYQDEPLDKLRQRLILAGDDLAKAQATMRNGRINWFRYEAFVEDHLNRDFLTFARTETANAHSAGLQLMLMHESGGEPVYVKFDGPPGVCKWCKTWLNTVCLLFPSQGDFENSKYYSGNEDLVRGDPYAEAATWAGKNNVGRKFAEYWICAPLHVQCSHHWSRWQPPGVKDPDAVAIAAAFKRAGKGDRMRRRAAQKEFSRTKRENRRLIEDEREAGEDLEKAELYPVTCGWARKRLRRL